MKKIYSLLRYTWLLHFFYLCTNWLPDNVMFIRLRGRLFGFCLGSCGKRFGVGRNVTFYNPEKIHVGDDVYIAYGCWFNGTGGITIENEVLFGPYCVVVSSDHKYDPIRKSFRFDPGTIAPIKIGKGSWIAAHVTVTSDIQIGSPSLIAANSVVVKSTAEFSVSGGVPAKFLKNL